MATGKITPDIAVDLKLCYSMEQAQAASVAGGKGEDGEYTVDQLLLGNFISHDDAMFMVCRPEITPAKVLREFAALVASRELSIITKQLGGARPFIDAVDFLQEGAADERPEELAEHAEAIQKYMVSALVIEGPGDFDKPDKIREYKRLMNACKAVRAATKPNPGEAAYGAALWAYKSASGATRDELGKKQRGQLAKIFKAHQ